MESVLTTGKSRRTGEQETAGVQKSKSSIIGKQIPVPKSTAHLLFCSLALFAKGESG